MKEKFDCEFINDACIFRHLYWMDVDLSSTRSKGRIFVSELDGRYRRAIIAFGLEQPTSLALDPEYG